MAGIIVDDDPSLDGKDRSFPAFWLPFQDVNSDNHSAQWVEKVQGGSSRTGGGDAGGTSTCVPQGGACGVAAIPSAAAASATGRA